MQRQAMPQELLKIIRQRHSTREPFDTSRPIAKPELAMVLEAARWAPTPANMQNFELLVVDDRDCLAAIAQIPADVLKSPVCINGAQSSPAAYRTKRTFLGRSAQGTSLLLFMLYEGTNRAGEQADLRGHAGLGCVMENMWLMAESLGIGFHVLTVFSGSDVEDRLRGTVQIPPEKKIAFVCGLGYAQESPAGLARSRRDLEEFVHYNQFGKKDVAWSSAS